MTGSTTTRLADGVALFDQSASYALDAMAGITAADLDRPTPCPGWDLRALLLHLADSADALANVITTGTMTLTATPQPDADAVAVARDRTHHLRDALKTAVQRDTLGPAAAEHVRWATSAAHGAAIEFAAHGWDISTTCGMDRQIRTGHASELLALSRSLISDDTRAPRFGPPVSVPAGATPNDRLIAFLGRQPATRG
ncbi:TIGR03086 family metal-binding protein [Micromonospora coerulea]|uniref:TIGR03086 family metal-binding protein n=1 Tax=Micromonospora coerulea TaxID=47856 RepID=A0ABP8SE72_9ACTN